MKAIDRTEIKIEKDWISIRIPLRALTDLRLPTTNWDNIRKARGILKRHKIDGLKYQRKIRKEWD